MQCRPGQPCCNNHQFISNCVVLIFHCTVNCLIFTASKFGDFKRLAYWCSLILAVSQFNGILKERREHIPSYNSSPFYDVFSPTLKHTLPSISWIVNTDYNTLLRMCMCQFIAYYPPMKWEGYSFGVVRASVHPVRPSVHTFYLSGTISQYLLIRLDSFLVQMISTIDSRYPISLVKIDPLTLELLPLF